MLQMLHGRFRIPGRLGTTPKSGRPETGPSTLGDLLYSEAGAALPETEWVRLVRTIAGGDSRALRILYERTHRLVFTLALRISGHRESAEEITLDVFHDVWARAAKYDPENGPVIGWIMNQARSRAIDRVRYEQRAKRRPRELDAADDAKVEAPEAIDVLDAERRRSMLQEALASLTPDERRTIETAFFSELTYSETAARLEQPLGTVKTRIRSGLAKLRAMLGNGDDA